MKQIILFSFLPENSVIHLSKKNGKIIAMRSNINGPCIWAETTNEENEEQIGYSTKIFPFFTEQGVPRTIFDEKYPMLALNGPENIVILGVLYDDKWKPYLYILEPIDSAPMGQFQVILIKTGHPIPDGYIYHSTSIKPNFEAVHLYSHQ